MYDLKNYINDNSSEKSYVRAIPLTTPLKQSSHDRRIYGIMIRDQDRELEIPVKIINMKDIVS